MTRTTGGVAIGAVLALTWVAFGFWAALFVALAMGVGAGAGRVLEGRLDMRELLAALRGRRSS